MYRESRMTWDTLVYPLDKLREKGKQALVNFFRAHPWTYLDWHFGKIFYRAESKKMVFYFCFEGPATIRVYSYRLKRIDNWADDVTITEHALEKFTQRSILLGRKFAGSPAAVSELLRLIAMSSSSEIASDQRFIRLIHNKCELVEYRENAGWRFVVKKIDFGYRVLYVLITCERIKPEENIVA